MPNRQPESEQPRAALCRVIEPLLAPYGEDAAPDDVRRQVSAHLDACPPCRDKAAACRAARQALKTHAASLGTSAPPLLSARCRAIALRSQRPRRAGRWLGWSAAGAAAAALLFIILMPAQAIATQLALDHVKCTKLGSRTMTGSPQTLEEEWMRKRGQRLTLPGDNTGDGLRLVGLRRCGSTDGSVAHAIYQHHGEPVSLFVMRDGAAPFNRELETVGHKAILWTEDARTYVLVGRERDLARTAGLMRDEMRRRRIRIE